MSIEDFLSSNPDLNRSGSELGAAADISLPVVVRGISENFVDFIHMGLHYRAERKDVVGLEETRNSPLGAKSAIISLTRDAILVVQRAISALDLANSIPFGFEKLSPVSESSNAQSARERAWLQATGYNRRGYAVESLAASGTFSTSTKSAGVRDDERADQFVSFEEME